MSLVDATALKRYRIARLGATSAPSSQQPSCAATPGSPSRGQLGGQSLAHVEQGTSGHMLTSRLYLTAPSLAVTDFTAIASSSVGGPSLRRPHTRFVASRNGDGNAVWVRRPLQDNSGDDRAGPQLEGGAQAAHGSPERGRQQLSPSFRLGGSPSSHRDGSPVAEAVRRGRRTSLPTAPHFEPPTFKRPYTTGAASPRTSAAGPLLPRVFHHLCTLAWCAHVAMLTWRSPPRLRVAPAADVLQPPAAGASGLRCSAWFQPPAATFLGGVPQLPGTPSWLRVDCGFSTERDFLMGASAQQRARHPAPTSQPARAHRWPTASTPPPATDAAAAPEQQHAAAEPASSVDQSQGPPEGLGADAVTASPTAASALQPHVPPWSGTGPLNPDSPHGTPRGPSGGAAPASPAAASPRHASPPGFQRVHGVWRPDTAATDAAVLATAGLVLPAAPPQGALAAAAAAQQQQQLAVPTFATAPSLQAVGQAPPGATLAALRAGQARRAPGYGAPPAGALMTGPAILQAIKDSSRAPLVRPIEFVFHTECRKALPPEGTLPRRKVPAVGK